MSKSEPKEDSSDKNYAVAKSFDDTTILDDVDNKIEQITTKQPEPESLKKHTTTSPRPTYTGSKHEMLFN